MMRGTDGGSDGDEERTVPPTGVDRGTFPLWGFAPAVNNVGRPWRFPAEEVKEA